MAAEWVVHLTTRHGLEGGLVETFRRELGRCGSRDKVALIVPTQRATEAARRLVLHGAEAPGALLDPRLLTFPQLAESVLVANHHASRQLTGVQREMLVADVLAELRDTGALGYLRATSDRPGAVTAVCALLDELKRGGISSESFPHRAAGALRDHPAHAAVAAVFARYQDRLQERDLYDEPGLFWNALEVLQSGARKPLQDLRLILLDGFQEFTTTQLQMLEALAGFVERVEVRLWLDEHRPLMTPRTAATRDLLVRERGARVCLEAPAPPRSQSNLEVLRQALFSPERAQMERVDGSVQALGVAGGLVGECREVARRLKLLLKDDPGLQPHQVAVFLRSWDSGYETALRQACAWYGVPADFTRGPCLTAVPAVQAALEVLDVVVGRWRRQDVIKLLNSNYIRGLLQGEQPLSPRRFERLALDAGIIGGAADSPPAAAWAKALGQLDRRLLNERQQRLELEMALGLTGAAGDLPRLLEDEEGNRLRAADLLDSERRQVERAQELVNRLQALLLPLEQAHSLAGAARSLGDLLTALGLVEAAETGADEPVALDLQGLIQLADLLREMAEGPEVLGIAAPATVAEFAAHLRRAAGATRLRGTSRRHSGVQVLEAAEAGLQRFQIVFLCGLRDGLFPARRRPDVFYSDAERQAVQGALPGLRPRLGDQHEDEYLFHGALAAAERQVWLTYPLTEASGSPVLRSLYVEEVLRHWRRGEAGAAPAGLVVTRRQSEVIVALDQACHPLEALEALQDPTAPLTTAQRQALGAGLPRDSRLPELSELRALSQIERDRQASEAGTIFAGVLQDAALKQALAETYGPQHTYSVSQLNTYAACPLRFFFQRVLGLEAPTEPTEGLDRRDLGSLAHRVLKDFFGQRRRGTDDSEPLLPDDLEAAGRALDDCLRSAADAWRERVFGAPAVWDMAIARLGQDLHALLAHEAAQNDKGPARQVRAVEATFGSDDNFVVQPPVGPPIRLRGRMDRVDLAFVGEAPYWIIWDYKTGPGVPKKLVMAGLDLQLPVYALAAKELFPGEAVGSWLWGYYRCTRPVGWPSVVRAPKDAESPALLQSIMDTAREKIGQYVASIRAGEFPAQPHEDVNPCRHCDFAQVCRAR